MDLDKVLVEMMREGKSEHKLLAQVIAAVATDPTDYERLLLICQREKDNPFVVAKVIVAVTAGNPAGSSLWLETITRPLRHEGKHGDIDWTFSFAEGVTLGVFQSAIWLQQHWKMDTLYDEHLGDFIAEMILYLEDLNGNKKVLGDWTPSKEYEEALSQAIKRYVREHEHLGNIGGGLGVRHARLTLMFRRIRQGFDTTKRQHGRSPALNEFATLVLDQLSYAWFGMLGPNVRMRAVSGYFEDACKGIIPT